MKIAFSGIRIDRPEYSKTIISKRHGGNYDLPILLTEFPSEKWNAAFEAEQLPFQYPGYVDPRVEGMKLIVECNPDEYETFMPLLVAHIERANDRYRKLLDSEERELSKRQTEESERQSRLEAVKRRMESCC